MFHPLGSGAVQCLFATFCIRFGHKDPLPLLPDCLCHGFQGSSTISSRVVARQME